MAVRRQSSERSSLDVELGVVPESLQARLGSAVPIAGEQVQTVTGASVWPRKGLFRPKAGQVAAGRVAQGWVTGMVPRSKVRGLTIVHHLYDNGPNVLVPFASGAM